MHFKNLKGELKMPNNNLSALLIGPTNKTKIFRFGKINRESYEQYKEEVGKVLAVNLSTVYLIPDEGIPLDFAKSYKQFGGREVVGALPKGGCDVLKKYFQFCDRTEEVDGGWSVLNTCLSLRTGLMIGFGLSPGTLVEIAYSKYHKKYLGRNIPVLLDERTISGRLNPEIEDEVNLRYFDSAERLNQFLKKLKGK
jgi:hypothetical protein